MYASSILRIAKTEGVDIRRQKMLSESVPDLVGEGVILNLTCWVCDAHAVRQRWSRKEPGLARLASLDRLKQS